MDFYLTCAINCSLSVNVKPSASCGSRFCPWVLFASFFTFWFHYCSTIWMQIYELKWVTMFFIKLNCISSLSVTSTSTKNLTTIAFKNHCCGVSSFGLWTRITMGCHCSHNWLWEVYSNFDKLCRHENAQMSHSATANQSSCSIHPCLSTYM